MQKRLALSFLLIAGHLLAAKADTVDNFQIYIKQKLIVTERDFNPLSSKLISLLLDSSNYCDTIAISFNHCTAGASDRIIMLKDIEGKIIMRWDFPDKDSIEIMKIPIIDIFKNMDIESKYPMSLHYCDNQLLSTGRLIAPVNLEDILLIKQKTKKKVASNNFILWIAVSILLLIVALVIIPRRSTNAKTNILQKQG